jgi:hypothetical protein
VICGQAFQEYERPHFDSVPDAIPPGALRASNSPGLMVEVGPDNYGPIPSFYIMDFLKQLSGWEARFVHDGV